MIKDLTAKLKAEKKTNQESQKSAELLEKEYKACAAVLTVVQEENERFKIQIRDMKSITKLADLLKKDNVHLPTEALMNKNVSNSHTCEICEYPFTTKIQLDSHLQKHQSVVKINNKNKIATYAPKH